MIDKLKLFFFERKFSDKILAAQDLIGAIRFCEKYIQLKTYMKLKLYIFNSEIDLDCSDILNPEELEPFCKVDSFYRKNDELHVKISNLKTNISALKQELCKQEQL